MCNAKRCEIVFEYSLIGLIGERNILKWLFSNHWPKSNHNCNADFYIIICIASTPPDLLITSALAQLWLIGIAIAAIITQSLIALIDVVFLLLDEIKVSLFIFEIWDVIHCAALFALQSYRTLYIRRRRWRLENSRKSSLHCGSINTCHRVHS